MTDTPTAFSGGAVIVSVDENQDPAISSLGAAIRADGDAVEGALLDADRCGYARNRIQRLSGRSATSAVIFTALDSIAQVLSKDDPFLFFYSGHGGLTPQGVVLVPEDAELSSNTGLLSSTALSSYVHRIPSKRKLIIVDACHSGGLTISGGIAKGAKPLSNALLEALSAGEGLVVIASSRLSEASYIRPGDSLSLFTKHLVDGLRGGGGHDAEGYVRVFDLFNFIAESVRREEPLQAPVYAAYHQDSNFPVAYCAAIDKRLPLPNSRVAQSAHAKPNTILLDTLCELYPLGPTDQDIWERAGGDLSRLQLSGSGRTAWSRAVRDIARGASVSVADIVVAASEDYPLNRKLRDLSRFGSNTIFRND